MNRLEGGPAKLRVAPRLELSGVAPASRPPAHWRRKTCVAACPCPPLYPGPAWGVRRRFLGAPVDTLCKSLVLVNTALPADAPVTEDPSTSRFIMVVLQYVSRLDTDRLGKSLRAHAPAGFSSAHRLAVAAEADSAVLTAYGHNAVTPPGCQTAIPVVVSEAIADLASARPGASVWLGGGHVDVKLRMPVAELLRAGALFPVVGAPLVLRCTDPRSDADAED